MRGNDWYKQAENDFEWSKSTLRDGFFAQVCFISQQVAEKALKALAFSRGVDQVKSHSVFKIAKDLGLNGEIEKAAKILDQYYITTRYPDSFSEGAPFEYFTKDQAEEAVILAKSILERVKVEI